MSVFLVAAYRLDIREHLALAQEHQFGLELQAFSHPGVLDGAWQRLLRDYKSMLADFSGPLACHGAFFDMSVASEDARVVALTRERYLRNLDIAAALGARHVVFHTNFLPMIRTEQYRRQYVERQVSFWESFAHEAAQRNLCVALENMWDPDPLILQAIFDQLQVPNMGICLDISHAYLYNNAHPVPQWIDVLSPHIIHSHINNTRGVIDEHLALNVPGGAVNFAQVLPKLAALPRQPWMVLELDDAQALRQSLRFVRRVLQL